MGSMTSKPMADSGADSPIDTSFLEHLVGYNMRRASLSATSDFLQCMAAYELRPVDFSVLSLLIRNPTVTSRQVCRALSILPPNLVSVVNALEQRGALTRQPHPRDKRADMLVISAEGKKLIRAAEAAAQAQDLASTAALSEKERAKLVQLLKKLYQPEA